MSETPPSDQPLGPAPGAADPHAAAYDRVQTRPPAEPKPPRPAWKTVLIVVGLVAAGVAAWVLTRPDPLSESENLLAHLVASAAEFSPDLATSEPDEAQAFVADQLGWAVPPPDLPGLTLVGAQVAVIGQAAIGGTATPADVVVPAFLYASPEDEAAVVYVYDYITLDRVRVSFDLPVATYAVLAEPVPVDTRRIDDAYLITWRVRSMIFTAVTTSESVFEQIGEAVSR